MREAGVYTARKTARDLSMPDSDSTVWIPHLWPRELSAVSGVSHWHAVSVFLISIVAESVIKCGMKQWTE